MTTNQPPYTSSPIYWSPSCEWRPLDESFTLSGHCPETVPKEERDRWFATDLWKFLATRVKRLNTPQTMAKLKGLVATGKIPYGERREKDHINNIYRIEITFESSLSEIDKLLEN